MMPRIFISHAWEDNEISRKLATQLKRDGAEIYIYYSKIEIETTLPEVFSDAIEWCDLFLLIWSRAAAASPNVPLEWQKAVELKKPVITAWRDDTKQSTTLPGFLFVNLSDFDPGYDNLAQLLNLNLTRETPSPELPDENLTAPPVNTPVIHLRNKPERLGEAAAETMIKKFDFFDMKRNTNGHGIARQFESQNINGDKVLFDPHTRLTWQKGGSYDSMWYEEAKEWLNELNRLSYASYNDWRLPTLEEAMSLISQESQNGGLYLDPLFDQQQLSIWTSDTTEKANRAWVVFFNYGSCHINCFDFNNFARAVRSTEAD